MAREARLPTRGSPSRSLKTSSSGLIPNADTRPAVIAAASRSHRRNGVIFDGIVLWERFGTAISRHSGLIPTKRKIQDVKTLNPFFLRSISPLKRWRSAAGKRGLRPGFGNLANSKRGDCCLGQSAGQAPENPDNSARRRRGGPAPKALPCAKTRPFPHCREPLVGALNHGGLCWGPLITSVSFCSYSYTSPGEWGANLRWAAPRPD